jgi:hypothetical protein
MKQAILLIVLVSILAICGIFLFTVFRTSFPEPKFVDVILDQTVTSVVPTNNSMVLITLEDGTTFKTQIGNEFIVVGKKNRIHLRRNETYHTNFWIYSVQESK